MTTALATQTSATTAQPWKKRASVPVASATMPAIPTSTAPMIRAMPMRLTILMPTLPPRRPNAPRTSCERRGNAGHRSTTDPEARLARKGSGKVARLCYAGHSLTENRNGLIVECELTAATGTGEREAGLRLVARRCGRKRRRLTVGADRGYDARDFVAGLRALVATLQVARKKRFRALDGRTTRHAGYVLSRRRRKLVEEPHGRMKAVGRLGKLRHRGKAKATAVFTFACAAYKLVRLRGWLAEPAPALR